MSLVSTVLASGVLLMFRAMGNTEDQFPISPGFTLSSLAGQWSSDLDHCRLQHPECWGSVKCLQAAAGFVASQTHPGASLSSTSCKTLHIAGICRSSPKSLPRKCFTPAQVLCFCAFVRLWCLGFAYVGGFEFFNLSVIPSCLMSPQLSLSISLIDALGNSVH